MSKSQRIICLTEEKKKNNKSKINVKTLKVGAISKNKASRNNDKSTIDSIYFNTISNKSEISTIADFKNETYNREKSINELKQNEKLLQEITENENHFYRKIIKSPTQRKKQFNSGKVLTEKEIKKNEEEIILESKKPRRNRDHLRIKSKKEYLKEQEQKVIENDINKKKEFFLALMKEENKFIKNTKDENISIKSKIMKTISATLNENIHLIKDFKPLYLNDYIKYCQAMLKHKKSNIYEVIDKEKLDDIERKQKINEIYLKNEKRKKLRKKIFSIILTVAAHLSRTKMSLTEFVEIHTQTLEKIYFFKDEFERLKSAIKDNNEKEVKYIIESNKYLCQMYDDFNQTPLHIAAKRKRGDIIRIILENGAKIDALDCVGRTALHYACLYNNLENVEILLWEFATPSKVDNFGKEPCDYSSDKLIKFFVNRAKNLIEFNIGRFNVKDALKRIRNGLEFFFGIEEDRLRKMVD